MYFPLACQPSIKQGRKMQEQPTSIPTTLSELESTHYLSKLQAGCRKMRLSLTTYQIAQFELYYRSLVYWNKQFNLTAITDYDEVQTKHFLDSLSGLPIMYEELDLQLPLSQPIHMVDVGSGAGFPGIPLKIAAPHLTLTLLDGTGKKTRFLSQVTAALELEDVHIAQGRAEELGRQPEHRERYDIVAARAVAPLNTLVEYLLPLVKERGLAMVFKGAHAPNEFMEARRAIEILGGETVRLAPVTVPFLDAKRYILLIRKDRPTPNGYPRGQGLARKQPLP